ncbi:hypothetical protein ACNQGN_13285, partial [Flavobacterium sp. XS2P39]
MKKSTIFDFFDFLFCTIINCFIAKGVISELDFLKFKESVSIGYLSELRPYRWRQWCVLPLVLGAILLTSHTVNAQGSIRGIVPVQYPISGSGVDGDAFAHEPIGTIYEGVGDLFDQLHPTIAGHGVINPFTGAVFYKPTEPVTVPVSYFLQDPYQNDPTIFTLSNKINDNPNTYSWGAGSSPNKNEIQNCGAHFSYGDPGIIGGVSIDDETFVAGTSGPGVTTDLWCLFAGDRQVTNGSSYIDFEFLQAPLMITGATFGPADPLSGVAPITGGSGGFTSAGTQGGRTVGDILLTIEFTQGGGDANVVIRVWTAVGGGFEYVVHPNSEFFGDIYLTNNFSTTTVPFDTYGTSPGVYAPNQWAEGAINLTEVLKATNNPCFIISTLFIRTRSSGSSAQSELKDFPGAPIQLNLDLSNLTVTCAEPVTLPVCSTAEAITTAYNTWKAGFSNTGGISPVTDNLADFPPLGNLTCGGQLSFEYKVFDACHEVPKTCTSTFTVAEDEIIPIITATGTPINGTLGCNPTADAIGAALGTATATDNCGAVTPTFADGTIVITGCLRSQTRTWNVTDACGNAAASVSRTATWTVDLGAPVIIATGTPTNGTLGCNPTADAINAALGTATATDNCGAVTPTFTDGAIVITDCLRSQTRTWNVTDACGNAAAPVSRTATWTSDLVAPVIAALPAASTINCPAVPVFAQATATDNCEVASLTFNDVTTPGNCAGNYSVTRTWTATDDCGNFSTATQTINVQDITAPVIAALPAPSTINCPALPAFAQATATDTCDASVTLTFNDVTTPGNCAGNYSVTRTWTATDDCGN